MLTRTSLHTNKIQNKRFHSTYERERERNLEDGRPFLSWSIHIYIPSDAQTDLQAIDRSKGKGKRKCFISRCCCDDGSKSQSVLELSHVDDLVGAFDAFIGLVVDEWRRNVPFDFSAQSPSQGSLEMDKRYLERCALRGWNGGLNLL